MFRRKELCLNGLNPLNNETVLTALIANGSKMSESLPDPESMVSFLNEPGPSLRTPVTEPFGKTGMCSGAFEVCRFSLTF